MCFSATASFVAGGALVSGGAYVLATHSFPRKSLYLAFIPIIFGFHQLVEGIVWLGIDGVLNRSIQDIAMYVYTFIAMCLWPAFIPFSMYKHEYPSKKVAHLLVVAVGVLISIYLLWSFTVYSELHLELRCNFAGCSSIMYFYDLPYFMGIIDGFYVAVVILPFLFSSNKRIRFILGPGFFLTFVIALYMQVGGDYPSIWCFLAAMLSTAIYYALGAKITHPRLLFKKTKTV